MSVDVQQWSWLREIRFDLERIQQQEAVLPRENVDRVFQVAIESAARISESQKVQFQAPRPVENRVAKRAFRKPVAARAVVIADEVTFQLGAPVRSERASEISLPQAGLVQDSKPSQSELSAMQQMHGLMRQSLYAAVATQSPLFATLPAQLDTIVEEPIRIVSSHPVRKVSPVAVTKKRPLKRNVIRASVSTQSLVKPVQREEVPPVEANDLVSQASQQVATLVSSYQHSGETRSVATQETEALDVQAPKSIPVKADTVTEPLKISGSIMARSDYSISPAPASEYKPAPPVAKPAAPAPAEAKADSEKKADTGMNVASLSGVDSQGPAFVRAFDWTHEVMGVQETVTTQDSQGAGWSTYTAQGYWSTLARRSQGATPMLSDETAKFLAMVVGSKAQKDAGIVFGRVPDGWSASFSGRSEQGLFLTTENKAVRPGSTDGVRYFAFVNSAPGAHLLHFSSKHGAGGAVAVPVINGMATYIDLERLKKQSVSGRVVDASAAQAAGQSGVRVKVVGGKEILTAKDGSFLLRDVWSVSDHPIFVETESRKGFTHRQQLPPSKASGVVLFRLGDAQAREWISQLEGGISPDSGMIVGVAPSEILSEPKVEHYPGVRPMLASSTLVPETYTLSGAGQLQVKTPLSGGSMRYLAVQVPEGPMVVSVGNGRDVIWSDLVVTSPGVISLLNP